jgi:type IV secretion system protein VirB9
MDKIKIFIVLIAVAFAVNIHAEVYPKGVSADKRIKLVTYDPNNVVVIAARYGYQTQIVFAPNETVQNVSVGDSLAWQLVPVNNNLFIKPVAPSKTNMTVLTSSNSYNFQIDSTNSDVTPTYKVQFIYAPGGYDQSGASNVIGSFEPDKLNWRYSFTGDRSLAPISAFDNGQFTYFKFNKSALSQIPAIFIVGKDRKETLVNYHVQGDYVVINTVAMQYTLRSGKYVTSVYNDYAIGDWQQIK